MRDKIFERGKALFLAYDHGMEHGPKDFNEYSLDPENIIEIARKGKYNGLILQKGVAEKYIDVIEKRKVPIILKLNGKTNLYKGEPISTQICSVEEATNLNAVAVGYTIYIGSSFENIMFKEFSEIQREAHKNSLPVIAWIYPRGKSVENKSSGELMAYAARVGLELGADIIKLHYNGNERDLKFAVKNAGRTKVLVAGGLKKDEKELLKQAKEIVNAGARGMAIGRNVWQSKSPLLITEKLRKIIFG